MKPAVHVEGADQTAKDLRAVGQHKDLTEGYRKVAKVWEPIARAGAQGGTRQQARMSKALKGSANPKGAVLNISAATAFPGSRPGGAVGSFMGAARFRQFDRWIGNAWQLPETGPYTLVTSYRTAEPLIEQALEDNVYAMLRAKGFEVDKT